MASQPNEERKLAVLPIVSGLLLLYVGSFVALVVDQNIRGASSIVDGLPIEAKIMLEEFYGPVIWLCLLVFPSL